MALNSGASVCRWLGVDHVFLTDNEPDTTLQLVDAPELQPFVESGFLTLDVNDKPHAQLAIYQQCLDDHPHDYNWMAFIDLDEYIMLRPGCVRALRCGVHSATLHCDNTLAPPPSSPVRTACRPIAFAGPGAGRKGVALR